MGCGCGGAKRAERPVSAQQQRRDGGSQQRPMRPSAGNFNDPGFTWNGPQRPVEPARA